MAAACCARAYAAYSPDDTYYAYAGVAYRYDSNVLSLPDTTSIPSVYGTGNRGDSAIITSAGGHYQNTYSRQTMSLDGQFSDTRYQTYGLLDYYGWNGQARWNWQLGSDWSGSVGYQDVRDQPNLSDISSGFRDVVRTRTGSFIADYALSSKFAVETSFNQTDQHNRQLTYLDYEQTQVGLGLIAKTGKGSQLTLGASHGKVDYLENLPGTSSPQSGYKQDQLMLSLSWPFSDKTSLNGNLGRVRSTSDADGSVESNRVSGLELHWQPTAKNDVSLGAQESFNTPGNSVSRGTTSSRYGGLTHRFSDKTVLGLNRRRDRYSYDQSTANYSVTTSRIDLTWTPHPAVVVTSYAQTMRHEQDAVNNSYTDRQVGVNIRLLY
jgi:hypothetical protein